MVSNLWVWMVLLVMCKLNEELELSWELGKFVCTGVS